jgi:hypothetical protein
VISICIIKLISIFRRILSYEKKVMKKYETAKQLADLEEKSGVLMRRINQWREIQLAYMPSIGSLVASTATELLSAMQSGSSTVAVEDISLFLPSSLCSNLQNTSGFMDLLDREVQLRIAQADDALVDIRHHLRIISGLWQFKKVNVSGTGNRPNTRMRALFNRFHHRVQGSVLCYRAARLALLAADPAGEWKERLQDLLDADVRGPGRDDFYLHEPGDKASKGRHEVSWIWMVPRPKSEVETDTSEQVFDEGLRVEWSKSQERKKRWEEEVHLIQEEMRRTIVYYEWKESWWLEQEVRRSAGDDSIQQGLAAYAQKQAYYCKCLAESFARAWLPFLESQGIIPVWRTRYSHLILAQKSAMHGPEMATEKIDDDSNSEEDNEEECQEKDIYDTFELDD